jgi:hypothetical protein
LRVSYAHAIKLNLIDRGTLVKITLAAAVFVLVALPAFAQQSKSKAPMPTKADAQKVAQVISGDKAKLQAYCESKKLYDQMAAAYKKNDTKTADALNNQADALVGKIGPEYEKLMDGLQQVDQNSAEGKEFTSVFAGLDKLCTGPALAQPDAGQPAPAQSSPGQPAPNQPPAKQPTTRPAPNQPAAARPVPSSPPAGQSEMEGPGSARPCAQIREACLQAGFIPNGASMGVGIIVDCIRPIMASGPQRKRAAKPLPPIDPQLVMACKNRNPNFGGGANGPPGGQEGPDQ